MRVEADIAISENCIIGQELARAKDNIFALQLALRQRNLELARYHKADSEKRRQLWLSQQEQKGDL
jgi:hypothetical protein